MHTVTMTHADWDTVIAVLTLARDFESVGYIDGIIDDIDSQIAEQQHLDSL